MHFFSNKQSSFSASTLGTTSWYGDWICKGRGSPSFLWGYKMPWTVSFPQSYCISPSLTWRSRATQLQFNSMIEVEVVLHPRRCYQGISALWLLSLLTCHSPISENCCLARLTTLHSRTCLALSNACLFSTAHSLTVPLEVEMATKDKKKS